MRARLSGLLYSFLWRLALPLVLLRLFKRGRSEPGYRRHVAERLGVYRSGLTQTGNDFKRAPVWVHAVSLGEVRASQPLVQRLLRQGYSVLLTHMTATGRAEGARLYEQALAEGKLKQCWLPYDLPGAAARFFRAFEPRCGLLIETEVWPNAVFQARRYGVPLVLVSGRMSARSHQKNRVLRKFAKKVYGSLALTLAQTQADADRLGDLGADPVRVVGNLKFDLNLPAALLQLGLQWRQALQQPVLALASTREGEEAMFIEHWKASGCAPGLAGQPLALMIPRHPQRFDAVAELLEQTGIRYVRRSRLQNLHDCVLPAGTQVILGDSLGEMPLYYAASELAIIGGSFAPLGGQNLIEANACGVPVIVGPHTFNFSQAVDDALEAGAALRAPSAGEAWQQALALLADPHDMAARREAAKDFSGAHAGATSRVMWAIADYL